MTKKLSAPIIQGATKKALFLFAKLGMKYNKR